MQRLLILLLFCLFTFINHAQELTKLNDRFYKLEISGTPDPDRLFKTAFLETGFHSLKEIKCQEDVAGNQHCRYEISIFNIPLKGFHLTTHYNQRTQITDYFIPRAIPKEANIRKDGAQLSMQQAIELAKTAVPATEYKYLAPSTSGTVTGLIYVPSDYNFEKPNWVLAYEIDVRAQQPLLSKRLTIDASNGSIIFQENRLCSFVPGTAVTRYHGTKTIETTAANGGFVLNDQTRGTGITTRNLNTGDLFFDDDNTWDNANAAMDEIAGDAHWGTAATFDFYNDLLGYNGIDANGRGVNSDVHLPDANAYWDGATTLYGDGIPGTDLDQPFTYINIIAHEVTHAVTEFSSGLIYAGESGAMNESISDIIGMSVENQTNPGSVDWLVGQEASSTGYYFRNMANPKELQMADTYDGDFWFDGNGVHTNSSIGNYWFYLLVTGETDVNDNGYAYNVTSLGWNKAYTIAHSTWTQYLSPSSTYEECALFSLEVAEDLYGSCSMELAQVKNAWAAVGVLTTGSEQNFTASPRLLCEVPGTVNFSANGDVLNPVWDFGDGNQSMEAAPMHTYLQNGTYTVTLSGEDCNNDPFTVVKSNFIIADDQSTACDTTIMANTFEDFTNQCTGIMVDDGGDESYSNSVYSTLEIEVPGAVGYEFSFDFFETESSYDYLNFFAFDGNNFVPAGNYSGFHTGESLTIESSRIRVIWDTDGSVTRPGFIVSWECIEPSLPVANLSVSDTLSCTGEITLTDESTGPPTNWTWLVDGQVVSTEENPTIDLGTAGTYDIGLIACNAVGCDSINLVDHVVFNPSLPTCQIIVFEDGLEETSTLCQGTLVDDGGIENNYSNGVDAILEIATPGAIGYEIEFVSFDSETNYDEMLLLVDNGNGFELFEEYEGNLNPFNITVTGSRIRFVWNTDGSITRSGFEINWSCIDPTTPPTAAFMLNANDICSGEVALTDQSTGFPSSWNWMVDGTTVSTVQDPNFTLTTPGTYDLTLIACNSIGCDTSIVADLITFNPDLPECMLIVMTDDLMASTQSCEGTLVDDGGLEENYSNSIDATLDVAAPGALSYLIDFVSFESEAGFDEILVLVDNGNGFELFGEYEGFINPFTLSVVGSRIRFIWNTDGSITRSGFEINWTCLTEGEAPMVSPTMEWEDCENTVHLAANSPSANQVTWDFGDGSTGEGLEVTHTYATSGSYEINATAMNAFGTTPFSMSANPAYNTVYFEAPDNMVINEVEGITISSPTEDMIQSINWEINGIYVSSNYSHAIGFNQPGTYELEVTITDINGCQSDFVQIIEVGTVGTRDLTEANIRIQPNPTRDLIHLLDLQILDTGYSLSLMNIIGQEVYQLTPASGTEQLTIDMSALPTGVYFLNIISPDQRYRGKRIIKVE